LGLKIPVSDPTFDGFAPGALPGMIRVAVLMMSCNTNA
jgi:hypothetical protein